MNLFEKNELIKWDSKMNANNLRLAEMGQTEELSDRFAKLY